MCPDTDAYFRVAITKIQMSGQFYDHGVLYFWGICD